MSEYTEKHGFTGRKINDGHWHISRHRPVDESLSLIKTAAEYLCLDKIAFLSYEFADDLGIDHTSNLKALYFKDNGEGHYYSLAALTHFGDERDTGEEFLRQVKLYYDLGFDGIKVLEGKTDYHEVFRCRFDSEKYEPVFAFLEETGFPIVMHIAEFIPAPNPEKEQKREEIQNEMLTVLQRHPRLRVVFAHMFNMAHDREKLTKVMETYPNVCLDLALGGDFIKRFADDLTPWSEFLTKFSHRIIYGTDTYNMRFSEDDDWDLTARHSAVRTFFEGDNPLAPIHYDIKPAHLTADVIEDIYINNFVRLFGEKPRPTDREKSLLYCKAIEDGYRKGMLKSCVTQELPPWLEADVVENAARAGELALENIAVIKKFYSNKMHK